MVRGASSEQGCGSGSGSPKRLTTGFLISVSSLMALCAKHASRFSTKIKGAKPMINKGYKSSGYSASSVPPSPGPSPRLPLTARPKQLLTNVSNKAITLLHKKRIGEGKELEEEEFGDGGVWQRAILMGDKCQPLDFSGVIYYDSSGKQLNEVPLRSPRASPLPGYLTRKQ